ncbi:hypothetical protein JT358_16225 [Micrococcales bacterium 31B]|nr:hypothetical protein [Micrococcales bacterium 31B]
MSDPRLPDPLNTPISNSAFLNPKRITPLMWVRPVLGLAIVAALLWLTLSRGGSPIAWGIIGLGILAVAVDAKRIITGLRNQRADAKAPGGGA